METIQQIHVSKMTGKLEGFKAISTNTTSNAFCLKMTKRKDLVKKIMKLRDKPKNLILIYSNPNKSAIMYDIPEHFDKTFNNVLEKENVEEQNCTGQKCKDCLACYKFNDTNVIVEKVKKY